MPDTSALLARAELLGGRELRLSRADGRVWTWSYMDRAPPARARPPALASAQKKLTRSHKTDVLPARILRLRVVISNGLCAYADVAQANQID